VLVELAQVITMNKLVITQQETTPYFLLSLPQVAVEVVEITAVQQDQIRQVARVVQVAVVNGLLVAEQETLLQRVHHKVIVVEMVLVISHLLMAVAVAVVLAVLVRQVQISQEDKVVLVHHLQLAVLLNFMLAVVVVVLSVMAL
jgi:hypothetical protein